MGQVTQRDREIVLERDGYQCVAEGQLPGRCWGHLDMGHLIGRGMGGGDRFDKPQWLTTQCRHHNGLVEDAVGEVRELCEFLGLHISRNSVALLPERPLVKYPDGHWYYLNETTKERATSDHATSVWLPAE